MVINRNLKQTYCSFFCSQLIYNFSFKRQLQFVFAIHNVYIGKVKIYPNNLFQFVNLIYNKFSHLNFSHERFLHNNFEFPKLNTNSDAVSKGIESTNQRQVKGMNLY